MQSTALIQNDAVLFGVLMAILGLVFYTKQSQHRLWKKFYSVVPALLMCYFLPSLLNTFNIADPDHSQLYYVASRFLLPASLVLLTLSIDLKGILRLGPKAIILFLTGTFGIIIGGPIAFALVRGLFPDAFANGAADEIWRGMTTLAGSWIGGGANQAAMKEVWQVSDAAFGKMVAVDVVWANVWMAILLFMAQRADAIDRWIGADTSAIEALKKKMETFQQQNAKPVNLNDLMLIASIAFAVTGAAHALANWFAPWIENHAPLLQKFSLASPFFWLIVLATTGGLALSFTKARRLEGAGASAVGSVFIYILVATIGLKMDITTIFDDPVVFLIGAVWIAVHAVLLLAVAWLLRAPVFLMAVGSQANVGGAASAPVVAAAFHPALAPVGVLLAVLGYAVGTYGAWLTGVILKILAG